MSWCYSVVPLKQTLIWKFHRTMCLHLSRKCNSTVCNCNFFSFFLFFSDLPSSRVTPHVRQAPRVFAHCDLCGPPLQPVVLEDEDWNNLHAWFSHLWPPASKSKDTTIANKSTRKTISHIRCSHVIGTLPEQPCVELRIHWQNSDRTGVPPFLILNV